MQPNRKALLIDGAIIAFVLLLITFVLTRFIYGQPSVISAGASGTGAAALRPQRLVTSHAPDRLPACSTDECVLVIREHYALSLDPRHSLAEWCCYHVTRDMLYGSNSINRNWQSPLSEFSLEDADYRNSNYQRGHLTPLASFKGSPFAYTLNYMENIVPQTAELNAGPWYALEQRVRDIAHTTGECYVCCGPVYRSNLRTVRARELIPVQPLDAMPSADERPEVPCGYFAVIPSQAGPSSYLFPQRVQQSAALESFRSSPENIQQVITFRLNP